LFLLAAVPVAAGASRLTQLASGAVTTPDDERFFASPVPVIVHIVSVTVFSLLGALQFVPALRRHRWHRRSGRLVLPSGAAAALSGLWMTVFYPHPSTDGDWLLALRMVFGTAMLAALLLGFKAVRRKDFIQHRAWMIRAYAIGMGAGTQLFTHLPFLVIGPPAELGRTLAMGAGWVINVAVAEWIIRHR
jgi:hypothetical protein